MKRATIRKIDTSEEKGRGNVFKCTKIMLKYWKLERKDR